MNQANSTTNQSSLTTSIIFLCIMMALYIAVICMFRIPNMVITYSLENVADITKQLDEGKPLVQLNLSELQYTGYDYYKDEQMIGSYYYYRLPEPSDSHMPLDARYVLVLIESKAQTPVLTNYSCRAKLLEQNAATDSLISSLASDTGLSFDTMSELIHPVIISEIDYPLAFIVIMIILAIFSMIVFVAYIVFLFTGKNLRKTDLNS